MRICVVGTGYVGLVSGTCFAEMGNDVICVDNNIQKIENLKKGIIPIYEPNLDTMVLENFKAGRLDFTTEIKEALEKSNIVFISVGTPMGEDGSADLHYVLDVAKEIGESMIHHVYIVDKSAVPVGTARKVKAVVQEELDKRNSKLTFDVISNPEFLKEGSAIVDCMKPDRVVIGVENDDALDVMKNLYIPFIRNNENFITMDIESAEMTKYAANCMLATKISFINEIALICEALGADVNLVRKGIGSDSRIGYSFIYPGCGYGGSCFPKDIQALIRTANQNGIKPKLLESVEEVNHNQKKVLAQKVINRFGDDLSGKTFAVWGLSFKPETDDMRESTAIEVINRLTAHGANIRAYDPKAVKEAKEYYLKDNGNVEYFVNKYDALNNSDALILITEWKEFRSPDFYEIANRMNNKILFDGRNQYSKKLLAQHDFEYYQIGVGAK